MYFQQREVGVHQRQGKREEGKTSEEKESDRGTEGKTLYPIPAIIMLYNVDEAIIIINIPSIMIYRFNNEIIIVFCFLFYY